MAGMFSLQTKTGSDTNLFVKKMFDCSKKFFTYLTEKSRPSKN